jgi:hypothetical protein
MNPLARYLKLVATIQYLHGRGDVFAPDEAGFFGTQVGSSIVVAHAITLSVLGELLAPLLELPNSMRQALHVVIWGLALALYVFLLSNAPYLKELRERLRQEPGGSSNRERPMWAFLIGSWLLALIAGLSWIAHAI